MSLLVGLSLSTQAQTQVNLAKQSKNADFSTFAITRPWQLVTSLPGTCRVGEAVFLTTAIVGQQLYFCSADNSWTLYTTTSVQTVDLLDFAPLKTGANQLTVGPSCAAGRPCRARFGEKLLSLSSPAVITLGGASSSGTLFVWLDQQGMRVGTSAASGTVSCNAFCTVVPMLVTAFPAGTLPLGAIPYVANVPTLVSGAMDQRAVLSAQRIAAGATANLTVTTNGISGATEVDLSDQIDLGGFTATRVFKRGTGVNRPVNCRVGDGYHQTDQAAGLYFCKVTNQWQGPLASLPDVVTVETRVTGTALTGDAGPVVLVAPSHAAGVYRICAVVTVTAGVMAETLDLQLSWRSPASDTNQTKILLNMPMDAAGESATCQMVRTTGEAEIAVDPSNSGAAVYTLTLMAERLL